jgi:parallel beta-helix repeat protein
MVYSTEITVSILYVGGSGSGNFSSIQEAVDAATSGDTVFVFQGTYHENIVLDTSLILVGEERNGTILNGRRTGNVIKINADSVTIQGFTITQSGLIFPNAGVNVSSNYNMISGTTIQDNFYGITMYEASFNTIRGNLIENNDHCGMYISRSFSNSIESNVFRNHTYNGVGVYDASDDNRIVNNSFTDNGYCGVNLRLSSNNTVSGNLIADNNIGIHIPNMENTIEDNTIRDNRVDIEDELILPGTPGFELVLIILALVLILIGYQRR